MHKRKIILCLLMVMSISFLCGEPAKAGLFGSKESKNPGISEFTKWTNMLQRFKNDEDACNSKQNCNEQWSRFIQAQKGNANKIEVLKAVDSFINNVKYKEDIASWKEDDYWETPSQFFSKGGDCEDYAIAKFVTLLKIGFNNDDMRIVVLNDTNINTIHAVLVVYVDGKPYLLDNQMKTLKAASEVGYYRPIYSINETNWWRHS